MKSCLVKHWEEFHDWALVEVTTDPGFALTDLQHYHFNLQLEQLQQGLALLAIFGRCQ